MKLTFSLNNSTQTFVVDGSPVDLAAFFNEISSTTIRRKNTATKENATTTVVKKVNKAAKINKTNSKPSDNISKNKPELLKFSSIQLG